MSNVSDLSDSQKIFRVNRLGLEVFAGGQAAFEQAIKDQQIRPDDLIFDQANNSWSFARNHPLFIQLSGEGFDDLKKSRSKDQAKRPWGKVLSAVLLVSASLYVLITYSKNIEFRQQEAEGFELSEADQRDISELSSQAASSAEGSSSGSGAGTGTGAGDGAGDGAGEGSGEGAGDGADEGDGLMGEQGSAARLTLNDDGLKMVFDLEAEGLSERDVVAMTRYQKALTDEVILAEANRVYLKDEGGRHGLNQLLKATADVEFVIRRARARDGRDHAEAKLTLTMLNERFKARCEVMYAPKRCQLKIEHPSWSDVVVDAISRGEALLGMSRAQVELALGQPRKVQRLEPRAARMIALCYDGSCERKVTLTRGVVSALP